jgi:hypothetical protein
VRPGSFQGEAGKEWEYLRVTYFAAVITYELGFPHLALILSGWNVMEDGNVEGDGLLEASVNLAWATDQHRQLPVSGVERMRLKFPEPETI